MRKIEGKGSWRRPMSVSKEQYDKNWELAFGGPYREHCKDAFKKPFRYLVVREVDRLRKRVTFEERILREKEFPIRPKKEKR